MLRHIMVIHESLTVRHVIRNYAMSELDDIEIMEYRSADKALQKAAEERVDMVICGNEMTDMSGLDVFKTLKKIDSQINTPFVLISSDAIEEHIQKALKQGIDYYLTMPFTPDRISKLINELSDPKRLRVHSRVSIKGTKVVMHPDTLEIGAEDFDGEVVNLSSDGLLADIPNDDRYNFLTDLYVSIQFPKKYQGIVVRNIWCRLVRIVVLEWNEENAPTRLRIVWQFIEMSDNDQEKLLDIIEQEVSQTQTQTEASAEAVAVAVAET